MEYNYQNKSVGKISKKLFKVISNSIKVFNFLFFRSMNVSGGNYPVDWELR